MLLAYVLSSQNWRLFPKCTVWSCHSLLVGPDDLQKMDQWMTGELTAPVGPPQKPVVNCQINIFLHMLWVHQIDPNVKEDGTCLPSFHGLTKSFKAQPPTLGVAIDIYFDRCSGSVHPEKSHRLRPNINGGCSIY